MLGGFVRADEDYRDDQSIALFQNGIFVDVDFTEDSAKFLEQRRDGGFGFFAKMAARPRVERNVAWAAGRELRVFGRVARAHGGGFFMKVQAAFRGVAASFLGAIWQAEFRRR